MGSPNPENRKVLVIGCGRAGGSLALTLARRGFAVTVHDRDAARARAFGRRFHLSTTPARRWDLVVLAVPDPSIPGTARALVREGSAPGLAIHLGGATPVDALAPLARAGWRTAKMHPVFAFPADPAPLPRGVAFGIGSSTSDGMREVQRWVRRLGGRPFAIHPGADAAWHLACVMAGNLLHAQISAAGTLMREAAEMPAHDALAALAPLVRSSLENAITAGPAGGLTGPVARGDLAAIEAHLALLSDQHPEFSMFYVSATAMLLRLLPPGRRAALRRRLRRGGLLL